jgi:IstB-like ATP binding protein
VAIASNDSFSGWTKTFTDAPLCAAIVDRLTFGGNIIETGTDSYRLAHTKPIRPPAEGSRDRAVTLPNRHFVTGTWRWKSFTTNSCPERYRAPRAR